MGGDAIKNARRGGPPPPLIPPNNFSPILKGVYRSAYPAEANVPYLRHIGIKTVVILSIESLPSAVLSALRCDACHGPSLASPSSPNTVAPSQQRHKGVAGTHEGGVTHSAAPAGSGGMRVVEVADIQSWRLDPFAGGDDFSQQDVTRALGFAVDVQWHPVLFTCPTGELQTSIVTGCMRRYQGWSLAAIFSECELFVTLQRTLRSSLLHFIESWQPEENPISKTDISRRNRQWPKDTGMGGDHYHRRRPRRVHMGRSRAAVTMIRTSSRRTMSGDSAASGEESSGADDHSDTTGSGSVVGAGVASLHESRLRRVRSPDLLNRETDSGFFPGTGLRPPAASNRRALNSLNADATLRGQWGEAAGSSLGGSVTSTNHPQQHHRHKQPDASQQGAGGGRGAVVDVVYAEWFEEARRRNPHFCVEVLESDGERSGAGSRDDTEDAVLISPIMHKKEHKHMQRPPAGLPPPHERYRGVRNPPALDERSTFTKESVVDEDDD